MKKILSVAMLMFVGWLLAGEDRHFIQDDDYFINRTENLENNTWISIEIAKMVEPASSNTKNEAKFMVIHDGNEIWTQYYWQTRPIQSESELKLGTIVVCFDYTENDVYIAPKNVDDSRVNYRWFMAKVVDLSKMYKGVIKVSGGYDVSKENIRILGKVGSNPVKTSNYTTPTPKNTVQTYQQTSPIPTTSSSSTGCGTLKIIKAVYGSLNNQMDVKDYLEEYCKNGQITATADDDFFNSSMDTNEDKNLYIRYQTMAGEFEVQVLQGESVTIPGKGHRRIK